MAKKSYKPTEYEKKLREDIIREFGVICPYIKVKEEDVKAAKEQGVTDEEIAKQFLVSCITQLYQELHEENEGEY